MAGEAIRFNASLNTAGFDSGAKSLQNLAASASAGITRHFGKIAAAVVGIGAAFIGVRAAVQAFNAAVAMGGQLNDLSARTGETAGNLAILQRAFENAGAGAESVGPTINRLQRAIVEAGEGGKEQAEAFGKLGLNLERLKDLTPTEQLQAVAGALQGVGNDSERGAIAMQLLERSGGELLPLLRAMGSELDVARKQLGSTPQVMDRVSASFDTIGDNFAAIGEKGKEFAAGLLEQIAPALVDVTTRLANIDAAGFGAKLSEYAEATVRWVAETFRLGEALSQIDLAIKAITSGDFGDGLSLMFMAARNTALNAINEIVAAASAAVEAVGGAVSKMFSSDGALMHLLKTSFTIAGNYFKQGLLSGLADAMEAMGPAFADKADTLRYQAETAARSIEMLTTGIGAQIDLVGEQAKEAVAGIPTAFRETYDANMADPLIDMTTRLAEAEAKAKGIADNLAAAGGAAATVDPKAAAAAETPAERIAREEAEARVKTKSSGGGGSGSRSSVAPEMTRNERIAAMRGDRRARSAEERAAALEDAGMFASADAARQRGQRRRNDAMRDAQMKDHFQSMGFNNFGEAYDQYRRDTRLNDRMSEKEFKAFQEKMMEQSKTPEERAREEEEARAKHDSKGGGKSDMAKDIADILAKIKTHLPSIDEKLPQHALV
jgi:hypothetical protein